MHLESFVHHVVLATACSLAIPIDAEEVAVIELRKNNGTTFGQLVSTHTGGANIHISQPGEYLIRSSDALGGNPSLSVGRVTLGGSTGSIILRLAERFGATGLDFAGVVNRNGVEDTADPDIPTTLTGWITGSLTGDVLVDTMDTLWLEGDIADDVTITAEESMSGMSLIARHIGGGVTIRCLGDDGGNGDIDTIRAGWLHISNPNSHSIGEPGDPVIIEADSVAEQNIANLYCFADMYATVRITGDINVLHTSFATNAPSGLTDYDADLDVEANRIVDLRVPRTSVGQNTGDLSGRIRVTDPDDGFNGPFRVTGIFDGEFIIDAGLDPNADIEIGAGGLLGQIVVNNLNASEVWDTGAEVTVGAETLDGPSYDETPDDLGGGAIGEVRFMLHDEACEPLAGTYSTAVEVCWLQFYGPLVPLVEIIEIDPLTGAPVGTGFFYPPVKVWREPNGGGSGEWVQSDYRYMLLPPGDGEHNTGLRIYLDPGDVFEDGFTYTITRGTLFGLRCLVPPAPPVRDFSHVVTVN